MVPPRTPSFAGTIPLPLGASRRAEPGSGGLALRHDRGETVLPSSVPRGPAKA